MERSYIRLETLIDTTPTTPSELRSGRTRMPASTRKHDRWAEPSEHEDPIQHLRTTDAILLFSSVVEWHDSQIKKIENLQNRCAEAMMPVFATTPTHAIQVGSEIRPLQITLNHMKQ